MGAANALAALRTYSGKVPNTSMVVLVYMALVARDHDSEPQWWEGHEMLAIRCYGYPEPVTKSNLRAVERAITPLFDAGAITTTRHASGHFGHVVTVKYRLWLTAPAPDENRRMPNASTRRKVVQHPTKSGSAPDENRRTEEKEEEEERDSKASVVTPTVEGETERARQLAALEELIRSEQRVGQQVRAVVNGHVKTGRKPLAEDKRQAILELKARGGLSMSQIAAEAGVGKGTVHRVIHEAATP